MKKRPVLKKGSKGAAVGNWQSFLRGLNFYFAKIDNRFGNLSHEATVLFQKSYSLKPDGVVGNKTWSVAVDLGYEDENTDKSELTETQKEVVEFPEKPKGLRPLSAKQREEMFGKFKYKYIGTDRKPEKVEITDGWDDDNIVLIDIPELKKATNGKYARMRVHKAVAYQIKMMFKEWGEAGLTRLIKTYAGAFYPRYIRGSKTRLSNHSWGTAFDINVAWNGLNRVPAAKGSEGSVRELVPIALKWGFYWGGWFKRKDGMHFEAFKIIPDPNA